MAIERKRKLGQMDSATLSRGNIHCSNKSYHMELELLRVSFVKNPIAIYVLFQAHLICNAMQPDERSYNYGPSKGFS